MKSITHQCPMCKKDLILIEIHGNGVTTQICLNCMWVFGTPPIGKKQGTYTYNFEPNEDKLSNCEKEINRLERLVKSMEILTFQKKVVSEYARYCNEKNLEKGYINEIGHFLLCQLYMCEYLLNGIYNGMDLITEEIEKLTKKCDKCDKEKE